MNPTNESIESDQIGRRESNDSISTVKYYNQSFGPIKHYKLKKRSTENQPTSINTPDELINPPSVVDLRDSK